MADQGEAAQEMHYTWDPGSLADGVAYLCAIIGYLISVLAAPHLSLPGFLLVTLTSVGWIVLFRSIRPVDEHQGNGRTQLIISLGLIASALLCGLAIYLGMNFNWLLAVVTVAVLTIMYPPKRAVALGGIVWLGTAINLFFADNPADLGRFLQDQATLLPAFLFAFAFTALLRHEFVQRARAEALVRELEETQAQLRAYAGEVEELAVTRERNRLAREIHDTLGHYLTILAVQLETALKLEERGDPQLHKELVEARRMASECLTEVRRSVATLRPADPTAHSFAEALGQLAAEFEAAQPDTDIVLDIEGPVQALPTELRVALYRCVQEALTNVRKHARATKVLVRVRVNERRAELTVLDNGQGDAASADGHMAGFGLLGMRERIALLNGTVTAHAEPSQGWRVEVSLPVPGGSEDESRHDDERPASPTLAQIEG
jgi:signal transduction histidine kinase